MAAQVNAMIQTNIFADLQRKIDEDTTIKEVCEHRGGLTSSQLIRATGTT